MKTNFKTSGLILSLLTSLFSLQACAHQSVDQQIAHSSQNRTIAGNSNSGGANGTYAGATPILLDRYEHQNIKEYNYEKVAKLYPEVQQRIGDFKDTVYGLEEVMANSPATAKRWEFAKMALTRTSKECLNASVYEVNREIVACQDSEFVRVSQIWMKKVSREDQIWTINHELLVGYLLMHSEDDRQSLESKLRKVNANIMARENKKILTWGPNAFSDFANVTGIQVYTQEQGLAAKRDFETGGQELCAPLIAGSAIQIPEGYISDEDFRKQYDNRMDQFIKEVKSLEDHGGSAKDFEALNERSKQFGEWTRNEKFVNYDKAIASIAKSLIEAFAKMNSASDAGVLVERFYKDYKFNSQSLSAPYLVRDEYLYSSWIQSEKKILKNFPRFISETLKALNASRFKCQ